jgi:hypothetical protein
MAAPTLVATTIRRTLFNDVREFMAISIHYHYVVAGRRFALGQAFGNEKEAGALTPPQSLVRVQAIN